MHTGNLIGMSNGIGHVCHEITIVLIIYKHLAFFRSHPDVIILHAELRPIIVVGNLSQEYDAAILLGKQISIPAPLRDHP